MHGINLGKVLVGGIVAGIVIDIGEFIGNMVLFADTMEGMLERFGLDPIGGGTIIAFNILGLAFGITLVWLYAAIRPRYGPGPMAAVCAGLFAWALSYLFPMVGYVLMGMYELTPLIGPMIWGAIELSVAAVAGAYFYSE